MRMNTKIEARWHQDNYLDKAGNLWKRSDPNRPDRSNRQSNSKEKVDLASLVKNRYHKGLAVEQGIAHWLEPINYAL